MKARYHGYTRTGVRQIAQGMGVPSAMRGQQHTELAPVLSRGPQPGPSAVHLPQFQPECSVLYPQAALPSRVDPVPITAHSFRAEGVSQEDERVASQAPAPASWGPHCLICRVGPGLTVGGHGRESQRR